MVELKPCPFCGGEAVFQREWPSGGIAHCADPECIGHHYEQDEQGGYNHSLREADAIAAWNIRTDAARIQALEADNARLRNIMGDPEWEGELTDKERAMIDDAWERHKAAKPCTMPPPGWFCSRGDGHEGPCAARQALGDPA